MKRRILLLFILVAIAALAAGAWWLAANRPAAWSRAETLAGDVAGRLGFGPRGDEGKLTVSGFIEAEEVSVGTELGGRIVALRAAEGDSVTAGQTLVELDTALLDAQLGQAEAEVAVAEATLAQVRAGVRPETLAYAQAILDQARVAEDAARIAAEDAAAMRDNPQQLELALTAARNQLGVLGDQTRQAEAMANSAQAGRDLADTAVGVLESFEPFDYWALIGTYAVDDLPFDIPMPAGASKGARRWGPYKLVYGNDTVDVYYRVLVKLPGDALPNAYQEQATATYQSWAAWAALAQAQAAREGAESYLAELTEQTANPLTLAAQANAAAAQHRVAASAVGLAQAQVEGMEMVATPEQLAAAEAQAEMARAALGTLRAQRAKFALRAPISGLVMARSVHAGEVALPGAPLLTLADLAHVTLTAYVPEAEIGRVSLGQAVSVTVDAYPDRVFAGTVILIGDEAEFTPKNVQTREERVNLVFAVRVRLANPDAALKPGMPADAVIPVSPAGGEEEQ